MCSKNNCTIRISTIQWDISPEPIIEESPASYSIVNGSPYICYHTPASDAFDKPVRTIITFDSDTLNIRRSGASNGTITYISGKKTKTAMDLGFSSMIIENDTFALTAEYCDDPGIAVCGTEGSEEHIRLRILVEYELNINQSRISRCSTVITLT